MLIGDRTCTLLGPEGPEAGTVVSATELSGPFLHAGCGRLRGGYRPYFENYTVDASIFEMTRRGCLVLMILKIISQFLGPASVGLRFLMKLM